MNGPLYRGAGWSCVVCCASGPSFSEAQAVIIARAQAHDLCRVIVCNNSWRRVPTADALYAADEKWWDVYIDDLRRARFGGELWTQDEKAAARYGLRHVRSVHGMGIPDGDDRIAQGSNSGHQIIGLAYRFGATRIILAGYDMQRTGGAKHWHVDHSAPLSNGNPSSWVPKFTHLADDLAERGVDVINASAATALTQFRRQPLDEALGLTVSA